MEGNSGFGDALKTYVYFFYAEYVDKDLRVKYSSGIFKASKKIINMDGYNELHKCISDKNNVESDNVTIKSLSCLGEE